MRNRLVVRLGSLVLGLGLSTLALVPGTAKAIVIQCSDENGDCEISNDGFDSISCNCVDESAFGGTGGDDWTNLSEAELLEVCLMELSSCGMFGSESGDFDSGFSDSGDFSDSGSGGFETGFSDTGETGFSESGSDTGMGTDTDNGSDTMRTSEGDSTSDGDGESTSDESTGDSESSTDGDSSTDSGDELAGGSEDEVGADDLIDAGGCGCSTGPDSGVGVLALFGMLGLLGIRRRRPV